MKFKTLTNGEDLKEFLALTEKFLKIRYPMEYIERCKVRAFYDSNENIVGGYLMAMEGPFRVIESLPENVFMEKEENLNPVELADAMEFTGLWLSPDVTSKRMNFRFWTQIYYDIATSGKKNLVYGYSLKKKRLMDLYSLTNPTVLFRGETEVLEGMKYVESESIEMASISYIRWALFHRGDFLVKKLLLPRRVSNKYFHSILPAFSKIKKPLQAVRR